MFVHIALFECASDFYVMTAKNQCLPEHEFALVLSDNAELNEELENAIYDPSGRCNDALISCDAGRIHITFSRRACSMGEAIADALEDFQTSFPVGEVIRVDDCNLVTAAEIGRKLGLSRQQIHQYIKGECGPENFPPPVCYISKKAPPLYYWCEVACWLHNNDMITDTMLNEAQDIALINSVLDYRYQRNHPRFSTELMDRVSAFFM